MDPNAVVLEISSDEEVGWDGNDDRLILGGFDDNNWILAELLDEFNGGDCGNHDGSDDSDEVVLVSEVLPSRRPRKKPTSNSSSLIQLDDDCVVLDHDPDKPVEVRNDTSIARAENEDDDDDSDDLLVVSETGQVACRDYPHPRHLCIKFPFSSTPNESHCDQCYCYVCDSLAPCVYWGNGSATMDHCHATDKDELWKQERKNAKNCNKTFQPVVPKVADVALSHRPAPTPALVQHHVQTPRFGSIHTRHPSANFRPQNRRPVFPSRSKLHPDVVHQYLLSRNGGRGHHGPIHTPVFKRTSSVGGATTANRHHPYVSHRGNSGNPNRQQNYPYPGPLQSNPVNTPVSYPPQSQIHTSPTVNPVMNQQWPLQPQFSNQSNQVNSNLFYQPQPHHVPSSSRPERAAGQPVQPSYPVPAQPPAYHVPSQTRVDSPSVSVSDYTHSLPDHGTQPAIDNGLNWPTGQGNDKSALAAGPAGLGDFQYDWIFDHQPVEPGFVDGPGSYGLTDFSSDTSFIDTGPIFDF